MTGPTSGPAAPSREAGAELDAEVARVVFGVTDLRMRRGKWTSGEERPWQPGPCQQRAGVPAHTGSGLPCHSCGSMVPRYSSDIAAAMTVFEAVVEMIGGGSMHADMEDARGTGFVCSVSFGFEDAGGVTGPLPLAICLAALMAVSAEREGQTG